MCEAEGFQINITYRDTHTNSARKNRNGSFCRWNGHQDISPKNQPCHAGLPNGFFRVGRRSAHRYDLRIAVIAYDGELTFYQNCGFVQSRDASPMFITSLWT